MAVFSTINTFASLPDIYIDNPIWDVVGDGTTDDSSAIQTVIDVVSDSGGGRIIFGAKSYGIGTELRIDSGGVTLQGMNAEISKLVSLSDDVSVLSAGSESTSDSGKPRFIQIYDLGFQNTASSTTYCVQAFGATHFVMQNCIVDDGTVAMQMRNCDMFDLQGNEFRVSASSTIALNLIQGSTDDITTGTIKGGQFDITGTDSICLKFSDGTGSGSNNEFNNILVTNVKFDGNNITGSVGADYEGGVRDILFQTCEFKDLRLADIDGSTNLEDGQKVFFTIDCCKILGNSSNPSEKKIRLKEPSASGSKTKLTIRGAGGQFQRFVDGIYVDAGSPDIYLQDMDASIGTNLIEVASGATPSANPNITVGNITVGGSVINKRGSNLIASNASYMSGDGNRFSSFALQDSFSVTVLNGATTAAISWSLDYTPNDRDINILPDNGTGGDVGDFWITSISTTGATLNLRNAPSADKTFRGKVKAG